MAKDRRQRMISAMSDLEKIAAANVQAAVTEIERKLRSDVASMHRRHSVTGMGGGTFIECRNICEDALKSLSTTIGSEYARTVNTCLWFSRAEADRLTLQSRKHLDALLQVSNEMVKLTSQVAGRNDRLVTQMCEELNVVRDNAWTAIDRELIRAVEEKKRGGMRWLRDTLAGVLTKLGALIKGG